MIFSFAFTKCVTINEHETLKQKEKAQKLLLAAGPFNNFLTIPPSFGLVFRSLFMLEKINVYDEC